MKVGCGDTPARRNDVDRATALYAAALSADEDREHTVRRHFDRWREAGKIDDEDARWIEAALDDTTPEEGRRRAARPGRFSLL